MLIKSYLKMPLPVQIAISPHYFVSGLGTSNRIVLFNHQPMYDKALEFIDVYFSACLEKAFLKLFIQLFVYTFQSVRTLLIDNLQSQDSQMGAHWHLTDPVPIGIVYYDKKDSLPYFERQLYQNKLYVTINRSLVPGQCLILLSIVYNKTH